MHFKEHASRLCKPYLSLSVLKVVVPCVTETTKKKKGNAEKKLYVLVVSEALIGGGASHKTFFFFLFLSVIRHYNVFYLLLFSPHSLDSDHVIRTVMESSSVYYVSVMLYMCEVYFFILLK